MVGCPTTQTKEGTEGTAGGAESAGYGTGVGPEGTELGAGHVYGPTDSMGGAFDDPASPLSKRVLYFDFDRSDVRPEYQPIIAAHADYLARHPKAAVILEGHTDERGSREYNLALGERRSQAVRQLMQLGASPNQMEVVSYGEERPAALGHDESAWQLNRRVEILYRSQ
jgi:peptidoglycan-associated lipoprotein